MQTVKCVPKVSNIEAVKINQGNIAEVCRWSKLSSINSKHVGAMVVKEGDSFYLMPEEEFKAKYDVLGEKS